MSCIKNYGSRSTVNHSWIPSLYNRNYIQLCISYIIVTWVTTKPAHVEPRGRAETDFALWIELHCKIGLIRSVAYTSVVTATELVLKRNFNSFSSPKYIGFSFYLVHIHTQQIYRAFFSYLTEKRRPAAVVRFIRWSEGYYHGDLSSSHHRLLNTLTRGVPCNAGEALGRRVWVQHIHNYSTKRNKNLRVCLVT